MRGLYENSGYQQIPLSKKFPHNKKFHAISALSTKVSKLPSQQTKLSSLAQEHAANFPATPKLPIVAY